MNNNLPIWVISLEKSTDRRMSIKNQLNKLKLDCNIFNAVDGACLTDDELKEYSRAESLRVYKRELGRGEVGAALSHAKLWEMVAAEQHSAVLILEDDLLIGEMLVKLLDNINKLPEDWEMINFWNRSRQIPIGNPVYDIYRATKFETLPTSLCCYLLNAKGAEKLIKHVYPIRQPADILTAKTEVTGLIMYGIEPWVVVPGPFSSTIATADYKKELKVPLWMVLLHKFRRSKMAIKLCRYIFGK